MFARDWRPCRGRHNTSKNNGLQEKCGHTAPLKRKGFFARAPHLSAILAVLTLAACSAPSGMTLSDTPGQGNGYWTVVDGHAVWKVYRSGAPGRVPMQDRTFHSICGKMCRPHLPE